MCEEQYKSKNIQISHFFFQEKIIRKNQQFISCFPQENKNGNCENIVAWNSIWKQKIAQSGPGEVVSNGYFFQKP